ncbi:MAG: flagellar basal body L-ring protein FlgH [Candidatus Rokubacteria bacterium]|nr:flagellar basal body L-ring protein FlgH [Candidatus Rokubacteria bacterium]
MRERSVSRTNHLPDAILAAAVAVVAVAVLLLVVRAAGAQALTTPSLWANRSASLVNDVKARQTGDILTIIIDETSTAEKKADTGLNRETDFSGELKPPSFDRPNWLRKILVSLSGSGKGKSKYDGTGSTTRTDKATGTLTARVARVLDNGNLVVEGKRQVTVNAEIQTIVVSGVVRPYDVTFDNTVRSSQIADAEVRLEGQGTVSDRQKPGVLQRVWDWLGF